MVDKELVRNKLINLEEYINDLKEYKDVKVIEYENDKLLHRFIERTLHLAVEAILDIGSHIISDERLGSPDNNSDIIKILARHDIIKKNVDDYVKMAKFRNIIVHDYEDIKPEIILGIVKNNLDDLKAIFNWYQEYIS